MLIWTAPPNNQRKNGNTKQMLAAAGHLRKNPVRTHSVSLIPTDSGIFRHVPVPDSPVSLLLFPEPIRGSVSANWSTASLICLKSLFVLSCLERECVSLVFELLLLFYLCTWLWSVTLERDARVLVPVLTNYLVVLSSPDLRKKFWWWRFVFEDIVQGMMDYALRIVRWGVRRNQYRPRIVRSRVSRSFRNCMLVVS